jgi:hypothetical protein
MISFKFISRDSLVITWIKILPGIACAFSQRVNNENNETRFESKYNQFPLN